MLSSTIKEYGEIRKALKPLLEGIVLCIDPSCGSKGPTGSLPGWAVSVAGRLEASGVIELPVEEDLWVRLQALHHGLRRLIKEYSPDVLVYEQIAPRRYGGGSAHSHASLLKAVGVTLSVSGPTTYIGLRPTIWTKHKRSTYVKSDEADAVEILYVALETASYISDNDPPRGYGKVPGKKSRAKPKKAGTPVGETHDETPEFGTITVSEGDTGSTRQRPRRSRRTGMAASPRGSRKAELPPF